MKMEQTGCSKTSEHVIQTPENNLRERTQPSEHGGSLKSRKLMLSHISKVRSLGKALTRHIRIWTPCVKQRWCHSHEGKRPLGRPRRRWEDNIKMDLQEVGGVRGDWMELAQDRDGWRSLVGTVRNFRVP